MLGYEKFGPYQKSLEYLADAFKIIAHIPKGNADIIDQLKRSSTSIPLNIAEGSGKVSEPDKRRFYTIARGSAMECSAILDILQIQFDLPDATTKKSKVIVGRNSPHPF